MVRNGLNTVYLTDKDVELIDDYIQKHFKKLKKTQKANRSAVVRDIVRWWSKRLTEYPEPKTP